MHHEKNGAGCPNYPEEKPTKVITVRMPPRLHSAIKIISLLEDESINKVCVAALEKLVEESPNALAVRSGEATEWDTRSKIISARATEAHDRKDDPVDEPILHPVPFGLPNQSFPRGHQCHQ